MNIKLVTQFAVAAAATVLSACGSVGIVPNGSQVVADVNNTVVATPSTLGEIHAVVGASTAFSVTFTTDDGLPASILTITAGLDALPAGWTGPASFKCATVSTGNGCLLNLAYQPTAVGSGSFTFKYSYMSNSGATKTGSMTPTFAATTQSNVVATASPAGQIAVMVGASSAVAVTFTTDNGQTATALSADLSSVPAGWSAPGATSTCATVNAGSGCILNLRYAPTAASSGTLIVNFAYTDNAGTAKSGSISIPYAATTQNNVIATHSPAGQVAVTVGASATVRVDFTTDDLNPATALSIMPATLAALPSGWTGPASFTCASVSTGNGCELSLTYSPTQVGGGTVTLSYGYTNNAGVAKSGTVNIAYAAGTDNAVVGTASPSGSISAIVGSGSQAVTITFNSSDGNPGSSLALTGGLTMLPAGWSGPNTFSCVTINTGNGCQFTLTFNPSSAQNGTLQLQYGYNANSGAAKTGSVMIPYVATTHNNVIATASPSGSISAVVNSDSKPVTLTFTTDDGNPASAVTVTSGLAALPAGWSGPAAYTCATASTGTGCQLKLTYAPTANGSGTISVGYSYQDDSGTKKTGTANIPYASVPGFLYVNDFSTNILRCAISGATGGLSGCTVAANNLTFGWNSSGLAFSGNWVYATPGVSGSDVAVCPVAVDGSLLACTTAMTFGSPSSLAVSGGRLYVADANGPGYVHSCDINNANGSLSNCRDNAVGPINTMDGVSVTATNAYIVDINGNNLTTCAVSAADGTLSACSQQTLDNTTPLGGNTPVASPRSVKAYGGNLYIGTGAAVLLLPIQSDGSVKVKYPCSNSSGPGVTCVFDAAPLQTPLTGIAFNNGYAYVSGYGNNGNGGVAVCKVEASGFLDQCSTSATPGTPANYGAMAAH